MMSRKDEYEKIWEEEIWRLYHFLTRCVEAERLPVLDQLKFTDFAAFCIKYTSRSVATSAREAVLERIFLEEYGDHLSDGSEEEAADVQQQRPQGAAK